MSDRAANSQRARELPIVLRLRQQGGPKGTPAPTVATPFDLPTLPKPPKEPVPGPEAKTPSTFGVLVRRGAFLLAIPLLAGSLYTGWQLVDQANTIAESVQERAAATDTQSAAMPSDPAASAGDQEFAGGVELPRVTAEPAAMEAPPLQHSTSAKYDGMAWEDQGELPGLPVMVPPAPEPREGPSVRIQSVFPSKPADAAPRSASRGQRSAY